MPFKHDSSIVDSPDRRRRRLGSQGAGNGGSVQIEHPDGSNVLVHERLSRTFSTNSNRCSGVMPVRTRAGDSRGSGSRTARVDLGKLFRMPKSSVLLTDV
jgi:hypothetical protein